MAIEVDLGCEVVSMTQFVELTDTPNSYSGQAGKLATVNGTEDGLEFSDAPTSGVSTVTGDGVGGTATDVVMSFPDGTEVELIDGGGVSVTQAVTDLQNGLTPNHSDLNLDDGTNPHGTTKSDVGLSNVDNTSDANKPVSTAAQTALDGKASATGLSNHIADTNNPHSTNKADVGLSNVDNTSDSDKPVSTATQTALDLKRPNISFITKTADYTPSGEVDNTYINVDSATDKTITFNTGAFAKDGDAVFFERINTGRILFANGTASISAAPSLSLISGGIGSIVAVIRKSASVYILTGTTE